jgi:hypothetical protein
MASEANEKKSNMMTLMYSKIVEAIGGLDDSKIFTMLMPGQGLNPKKYAYDVSKHTSVLTRPYTVAEAEFRLSDNLFNPAPITSSSNGTKLSTVYELLINNYAPNVEAIAPFIRDRAGLSKFLRAPSEEKDENGNPISRMELAKKLTLEYLEKKAEWKTEQNTKYDEYKAKDDLEGYSRWMTNIGSVRQEEINSYYNDMVVRGKVHEIMTILGYLNASSQAEDLEKTKQRMRHSKRLSLDESMSVYPVHFVPNNWFKALEPNLNPEDLTNSQDALRMQLLQKRKELSACNARLRELDTLSVSDEELAQIEEDEKEAKKEIAQAESELVSKYGGALVQAVKSYLSFTRDGGILSQLGSIKPLNKLKDKIGLAVTPSVLKDVGLIDDDTPWEAAEVRAITDSMLDTYNAHKKVLEKAEQYTNIKRQRVSAESKNWKLEKLQKEARIGELKFEIEYLEKLSTGAYANKTKLEQLETEIKGKTKEPIITDLTDKLGVTDEYVREFAESDTTVKPLNNKDRLASDLAISDLSVDDLKKLVTFKIKDLKANGQGGNLPLSDDDAEAAGLFQEIVITSEEAQQASTAKSQSSASSSSWNVSGWFFNAGGSRSSASAASSSEASMMSKKVTIGFRVAQVSFDRGGWFNPQMFKMSKAFYKLDKNIVAISGTPKKKIIDEQQSVPDSDLLPAFPTSMIVAKDIVIKVDCNESESSTMKSSLERSSSFAASCFGFSYNNSSSNKSMAESAFSSSSGKGLTIRIPGPQVLGYYQQLVGKDESEEYESMFDEETGATEIGKALTEYEKIEFGQEEDSKADVQSSETKKSSDGQ